MNSGLLAAARSRAVVSHGRPRALRSVPLEIRNSSRDGRLGRSYWALSKGRCRWKMRGCGGKALVLHEGSSSDISRIDVPAVVEEDLVHVCRGVGETSCVTDIFLYFCPSIEKEGDDCDLICVDGTVELVRRDV